MRAQRQISGNEHLGEGLFQVMKALTFGPQMIRGIRKLILAQTRGQIEPSESAIRQHVYNLLESGLVEEAGTFKFQKAGKLYLLTPAGAKLLRAEISRRRKQSQTLTRVRRKVQGELRRQERAR